MGMTREETIKRLYELQFYSSCKVDERANMADIWRETVSALDMAIAALREQPQWISVEERLPDEFVSVLVYMPGESPLPTVHEGFLAREGVWYANHFDREPTEITHWMPLPEPPKEEV